MAPLYSGGASSCSPATRPLGSAAYAVHVLAPATFVAAREATDPRGARIGARVLLAEDGAAEVVGYLDETTHARCDVIQESIGWDSDLCIPATMAWANEWADTSCTQVAAHIASSCPEPTIAVDAINQNNCWANPTIHAYAVGAPIATAYFSGPGCSSLSSDTSGDLAFATAGPIDTATIPAVGVAAFGSTALRTYFRASPDGVPILPVGLGVLPNSEGALFRDVARSADCWATQLADGSWRCLPAAYALVGDLRYFADAACTQEVVDAGDFSQPCPPIAPVVALRAPTTACGSDARVETIYALSAPMPAGAVYSIYGAGGSCLPASVPTGDRLYPLGAPIDPTTFPSLTERTE
jgi:hypothetical protein